VTNDIPRAPAPAHDGTNLRLALVYAAGLLAAMGYGVTFVLPLYVAGMHGNEVDVGRVLGAGVVGTLICVPFAGTIADRISADRLAALAALVFGAGMLGLSLNAQLGPLLLACGFLLGCGWGLFFTATPMVVARYADDARRSQLFSLLSAFQMVGIGGGPVLAQALLHHGVPFHTLFLGSAGADAVAAAVLLAGRFAPVHPLREAAAAQPPPALRDVLGILRGEAVYPIVMVFLGASVFSALFNFQATFAASRGLDYTVFYVTYTVVVIGLRFFAAGFVGRQQRDVATIGLLVTMTAAVALLFVANANDVVYGLAAALLGAGYGLVYPLIQAQAVAASPEYRATLVLTVFSVSYFVGIFGFPLVAGYLIVRVGYGGLLAVVLVLAAAETGLAAARALRSRSRRPVLSSRGIP